MTSHSIKTSDLRADLLIWYDRHARTLPWRSGPGETPDPYHVWLSEIMLQQTTVASVKSYFKAFVKTWPDIHALAKASNDAVMAAWAGLGYYARARNLHKCARIISADYNGIFPKDEKDLLTLPGIGAYTAAAIASIAFSQPAVVVDGNIERIIARLFTLDTPLPKGKVDIKSHAGRLMAEQKDRPGDFAQALMDIGSSVCTPKNPKCTICPLNRHCAASKTADPAQWPKKAPKKQKPIRHGTYYWIENSQKQILVHKRQKDKGMLAHMTGIPVTGLNAGDESLLVNWLPADHTLETNGPEIRHIFTHFEFRARGICLYVGETGEPAPEGFIWMGKEKLIPLKTATLFRKIIDLMTV